MTMPGELDPDIIEKPISCPRCERLERSLDAILEIMHDMEAEVVRLQAVAKAGKTLVKSNRGGYVPGNLFGQLERALAKLEVIE
jgi:hypothetical protein